MPRSILGRYAITDAQPDTEPGAILRLHLYGPRGGYVGSVLLNDDTVEELIRELIRDADAPEVIGDVERHGEDLMQRD